MGFSENLSAVRSKGKWGFIDMQGSMIIPMIYDNAGWFNKELAIVEKNGRYGYINKNNEILIPIEYDAPVMSIVSDTVKLLKDSNIYTFDLNGQLIETLK